jgi:RimJ/RimL family protein N-acetyltransferase
VASSRTSTPNRRSAPWPPCTGRPELLARYLFAHTTAHRIWAGTETGKLAEQLALGKAGFTREGVIRAAAWRDGSWRDGVIYGLLRTDPGPTGR